MPVPGVMVSVSTVAGAGLVVLLSACTPAQQDDAIRTADDFVAAVADGDGRAACAQLAPVTVEELEQSSGSPCAKAVLGEATAAGERVEVNTFGTMSQVRYTDDVLFLSRFDDGWRIVAAGCVARRGGPYSCGIEGR